MWEQLADVGARGRSAWKKSSPVSAAGLEEVREPGCWPLPGDTDFILLVLRAGHPDGTAESG